MQKENKRVGGLSFTGFAIILSVVFALIMGVYFGVSLVMNDREIDRQVDYNQFAVPARVGAFLTNNLNMLNAVAEDEWFYGDEQADVDKARRLNSIAESFNMESMSYIDSDMFITRMDGSRVTAATYDFVRSAFSTRKYKFGDVYRSGSGLVTAAAMPILQDGKVVGAIMAEISMDRLAERLLGIYDYDVRTLFGEKNTMFFSAGDYGKYGDSIAEACEKWVPLSTSAKELEIAFYEGASGKFWAKNGNDMSRIAYAPIKESGWTFVNCINFWDHFYSTALMTVLICCGVTLVLYIITVTLFYLYFRRKTAAVNSLVSSVKALEERLYKADTKSQDNIDNLIDLTSKGLSDGLTGLATRTIFNVQVEKYLAEPDGELRVLCYVDLDNLKIMNDSYGHEIGDIAIKNTSFVLKEYERRYHGLAGRFGGDEFVLYMHGFSSKDEILRVLAELTAKEKTVIPTPMGSVYVQSSVGAVYTDKCASFDGMLKAADEQLYKIKKVGKGDYSVAEYIGGGDEE